MKQLEIFAECSDEFIAELMLAMRLDFASPFSIIIQQGSVGHSMYIIRKGFAAVYRGHSKQDVASTVILGAGQAVGEIALLADDLTRTASVVALEWLELAVIDKQDFQALISSWPKERFKLQR